MNNVLRVPRAEARDPSGTIEFDGLPRSGGSQRFVLQVWVRKGSFKAMCWPHSLPTLSILPSKKVESGFPFLCSETMRNFKLWPLGPTCRGLTSCLQGHRANSDAALMVRRGRFSRLMCRHQMPTAKFVPCKVLNLNIS